MKLLLLGGSSFVGSAVRHIPEWPSNSLWTYRSGHYSDPAAIRADLLDESQVAELIRRTSPTHLLDCSLPGREEPAQAARYARHLCDAVNAHVPQARYVLVSSDAVFAGNMGRPYTEDDLPDAISTYGTAKAAVETIVRQTIENCCIARTCLVYGRDWRREQAVPDARILDVASRLRVGQPVYAYVEQFRTPTPVDTLAAALLKLVLSDVRSILHLAGPARISRSGFARQVALAFGLDERLVLDQPLPERPIFGRDTSLDSARAGRLLGWSPPSVREGLARLSEAVNLPEAIEPAPQA